MSFGLLFLLLLLALALALTSSLPPAPSGLFFA